MSPDQLLCTVLHQDVKLAQPYPMRDELLGSLKSGAGPLSPLGLPQSLGKHTSLRTGDCDVFCQVPGLVSPTATPVESRRLSGAFLRSSALQLLRGALQTKLPSALRGSRGSAGAGSLRGPKREEGSALLRLRALLILSCGPAGWRLSSFLAVQCRQEMAWKKHMRTPREGAWLGA